MARPLDNQRRPDHRDDAASTGRSKPRTYYSSRSNSDRHNSRSRPGAAAIWLSRASMACQREVRESRSMSMGIKSWPPAGLQLPLRPAATRLLRSGTCAPRSTVLTKARKRSPRSQRGQVAGCKSNSNALIHRAWVFTALAVMVRPKDPRLAVAFDVMRTALQRLLGLILIPDLPLQNRDLCQ